jgi:glycosyltransferase involved in cell wall biosynthesis
MEYGISIIIPHFNRSKIIHETLKSIDNQSVHNWEIIIVDDGSDQMEFEQLQRYQTGFPNTTILQRTEQYKKGANACRNIGIEKSKYNWVMFLDSDDLIAQSCVEKRLECISFEADMIIFNMQRFNIYPGDSSLIVNKYHEISGPKLLLEYFMMFKLPWPITSVLWRKAFLAELMFDENLLRFQDVDIHIRALIKKPQLNLYPIYTPDCYYRASEYVSNINDIKRKDVLNAGFYLINKIKAKVHSSSRSKLLGLLFFLCNSFAAVIDFSLQKKLIKLFLKLSGSNLNINGLMLLLLSNKYMMKIPGLNYLRQRTFYFGRKRL